ncbi:MAG: NrfD/PsrC family molybdoenzyme membrane anchor subunit [Candidatus Kapaibacteriota bacterium]
MRRKIVKKLILFFSLILLFLWILSLGYTLITGLEKWGITNKTVWGVAIVNFVFWIGNSHAGTLISAILYLIRQDWRSSIHRIAETFTIISIIISAVYPLVHLGRPWFFYWMFTLPNQMQTWPNFKSPLIWDLYAILTYATLSFFFWILGIIPDHWAIKFNQKSKFEVKIQNLLKMIWSGSEQNWADYKWTYHIFAGILAFVVVSVHSIVSYDFSATILPHWHSTMLPIFFVIGAIYSGIALILLTSTFLNHISSFGEKISPIALNNLSKLLLTFSLIVLYFHLSELFFTFYSQNPNEKWIYSLRFKNEYITLYITMCSLVFILPQLLWFKMIHTKKFFQFLISAGVLIGMWLERYLLIIPVLSADTILKQTVYYSPTLIDLALTLGSVGFFVLMFYVISRKIPIVPLFEA